MQILKTRPELESAIGSASFGYIGMQRKKASDVLHAGHEALISYSKANFDITVVNFWDPLEMIYSLYGGDYFLNEIGQAWDSTGCLTWCEAQGVDYVLMPDDWYSTQYLQQLGIDTSNSEIYTLVDTIWTENNYADYKPGAVDSSLYNTTLRAKTFVLLQNYKNKLNCTFVSSWKDGEPRFTLNDYIKNHSTEDYHLIDPVKTPDGLYYSSAYFQYTQAQKDLLLQVESVVDSVGYSDTTALISALEALNTGSEDFEISRLDITYGNVSHVVGENNDFIRILYTMGSLVDAYPIYKKGVR